MKTNKMSNGKIICIKFFLTGILLTWVFQSCGPSEAKKDSTGIDQGFSAYISGYTGGVVSSASAIIIQFAQISSMFVSAGEEINAELFEFDPDIKGKATWVDQYSVEFQPAEKMQQGTTYEVKVHLDELFDVPGEFEVMKYSFSTLRQNLSVDVQGVFSADVTDLSKQKIHGVLMTADVAESENAEKTMTASQEGISLKIDWEHGEDQKSHRFTVSEVKRSEKESGVDLSWNGDALGVEVKGTQSVIIPSLGDFKVMNTRVVHLPRQYIALQFSDPILEKQDLSGLITSGIGTLEYIIDGNEIRVYPSVNQTGVIKINVSRGIKNIMGYKLEKDQIIDVALEQVKPGVRLARKGIILPASQNLIFPFEAVNLNAVDIRITRIYENNISQFLQVNELNGTYELQRVGYPVVRKKVILNNSGVTDVGKWNRFTLDLSEMMKAEPGAIYQVQIGFKKSYSAYSCGLVSGMPEKSGTETEMENWDETEMESSYWDLYNEYDYYYPSGYDWEERENPCHVSYFTRDRFINSNLLASDLGLMCKIGIDENILIVVTNLITTEPVGGVKLDVFDFQQQLIRSVTSDNQGQAAFKLSKKPFLLVASRGTERGYLKLDDGTSLSLSNFNVGGERVQHGIKGFIYGERGVWRPGDSLHLAFILEDKIKLLPDNHPVIFELINPNGQLDHKIVKTESLNGFYKFSTRTRDDAITGNWMAKVKVGGAEFNKQVKIETIKPNRLKIDLDFGTDRLAAGEEIVGDLTVKWLHGAIAANLRAEFEVSLQQSETSFPDFQDYVFDDPARQFSGESYPIFDGRIDGNGKAKVPVSLHTENAAPGMLRALFKGRVYEESGDFSVDMFSMPYYPFETFVGLQTPRGDRSRGMLLTDTTHIISIASVNNEGKGISRNGIEVEVYKLDWRWWWDNSSDDYLGNYLNSNYHRRVLQQKVNTVNGKGSAKFKISYPEWGRYLIRVSDPVSGHCSGKVVFVDWPGWAGRGQKEMPGGATMLSFAADKESYVVGETISLTVPGSGDGRAFISVENGSKIIRNEWMETKQGENMFRIPVTEEFSPNVFIYVSLLQPHAQTLNDLPIRLYGIVPARVDDPKTHLTPVIKMTDEIKPESEVSINISEAGGNPMTYTLAVVDEGLLDLTNYKTPDPWDNFYRREGLGVKTWDIFDDVIGAFGGDLERLLSIGGDEEIKRPEGSKANRFMPVVLYFGPFHLEKGENANHKFKMPAYIGSVRTMVVAGEEGAYGIAENETPVRQPLMVLATLPRVLGPGEEVTLPVTIFSYDPTIRQVEARIEIGDVFEASGGTSRTISFGEPGDQVVNFDLRVRPGTGVGTVKVNVKSGNHSASDRIEIDIRNPNPPAVTIYESMLEAGKAWETNFQYTGIAGTNKTTLEVSGIPPIDLDRRLNYLLRYPYGCVEQTTSTVFPQLYLRDIADLTPELKNAIDVNVKAGIERLKTFQNTDGGFKYWPNNYYADEWSSSYAGHFLVEARKKGYNVPEHVIREWIKYQKRQVNLWSKTRIKNSELVQAYRLYTLALAGEAQVGSMNRLRETDVSPTARWRLAAAYQLAGLGDAAKEITNNIVTTPEEYRELSYTYGSALRDEAMILEALVLMGRKNEGMDLMKKICSALSNYGRWMSTQEIAYSLIAVASFAGKEDRASVIAFDYTWNDSKKTSASTELVFVQKSLQTGEESGGRISLVNTGSGIIYARLIHEGIPAASTEKESSNGLSMTVTYKDPKGNLVDISRIGQGNELLAEVSIGNPGTRGEYKELALSQVFPSGFEIINERLVDETPGQGTGNSSYKYQDIRDDRIYTYFDLAPGIRKIFKVKLIAAYAGKFYLPGVYCEAMYDNSINARTTGQWVEITLSQAE